MNLPTGPDSIARRTLLASALLLALPARAAKIADQHFDDRIRLADHDLVLNGVGVRAVAWFTGYAAGLYLLQKSPSAERVLAAPGPKRLQMKLLVEVEAKEFVKAFDKGMRRNLPPAVHAAMQPRIERFDGHIHRIGVLKKGDVVDLDFVPGTGTLLRLNGKPGGDAVPGEDFYAGLLAIFVGQDPVDQRLKSGLLGAS
jgi:hypothetical protein